MATNDSTQVSVNDGYYEIMYAENGVSLTVYPPEDGGKRVMCDDVLRRLNNKKIDQLDRNLVELTVMNALKTPVRIAPKQAEKAVDATLEVKISQDEMKGYIIISAPEGGRMLTLDEIVEALFKNGIVYGINKEAVLMSVKYPVYSEMILVAEGTPAQNGQNGKVDFKFDVDRDRKPTILDDGRVDFRELNLIESVTRGQVLAVLLPPTPAQHGKTIKGKIITAQDGKPGALPKGRNVVIGQDGVSLLSLLDGQVNIAEGKISVFANYEVQADVDNSVGNINFIGNVMVRGNVLTGFTIEAGGNVEVFGVVEGAAIKAGGDIILRRGMQGMGKGSLTSGGDIIAKYIDNATVVAKENIKAEAIMHSNVKCGSKLELGGKKGLLVGGTCRVGKEVAAKTIGSHMATVTEIEVGLDPAVKERYRQIKDEISQMESDIKKADQAITLLRKLEEAGNLSADKQELMNKSVRTKVFFGNRLQEIKEELSQIEGKLQQDVNGKIKVGGIAYPGTRVAIGSCMMYIKENLQYCTLQREGADIRIGPYDR